MRFWPDTIPFPPRTRLDFAKLPLPLRWDRNAFSGLLLGLALSSEPLSYNDFVLHLRGEFDISLTQRKDWEILAPQVNGTFREKSSFSLLTLDVTLHYQGFTGHNRLCRLAFESAAREIHQPAK